MSSSTKKLECKDNYFVFLKPIDEASKNILAQKNYKNDKSVIQMWEESL